MQLFIRASSLVAGTYMQLGLSEIVVRSGPRTKEGEPAGQQ